LGALESVAFERKRGGMEGERSIELKRSTFEHVSRSFTSPMRKVLPDSTGATLTSTPLRSHLTSSCLPGVLHSQTGSSSPLPQQQRYSHLPTSVIQNVHSFLSVNAAISGFAANHTRGSTNVGSHRHDNSTTTNSRSNLTPSGTTVAGATSSNSHGNHTNGSGRSGRHSRSSSFGASTAVPLNTSGSLPLPTMIIRRPPPRTVGTCTHFQRWWKRRRTTLLLVGFSFYILLRMGLWFIDEDPSAKDVFFLKGRLGVICHGMCMFMCVCALMCFSLHDMFLFSTMCVSTVIHPLLRQWMQNDWPW
jgi:hypothetical protein